MVRDLEVSVPPIFVIFRPASFQIGPRKQIYMFFYNYAPELVGTRLGLGLGGDGLGLEWGWERGYIITSRSKQIAALK